jgi:hypothetical protein
MEKSKLDWLNTLTNNDLIKEHRELKAKIRKEQAELLNKKEYLENKLTSKRLSKLLEVDTSKVNSKALFAGNVNDVNSIIWPFFFQSKMSEVPASKNEILNINITQEAPFCLVSMQKVVFYNDGGDWKYLDPRSYDNNILDGNATGLKFTLVDSQSGRNWFEAPVSLDHIGDGKDTYDLPSPVLMLPNSNMEVQLFNSSANDYYVGFLFMGYRVRVEDAQNILSNVTA